MHGAAVFALPAAVLLVILLTTAARLHPFFALLLSSIFFGVASGLPVGQALNAFMGGLGDTVSGVGVIILAGSVIGEFLNRSGAVTVIASRALAAVGPAQSLLAMVLAGFAISIPVFADAAFVVLRCRRAGANRPPSPRVGPPSAAALS
jgi:GntP family gluconate:H+ symporter